MSDQTVSAINADVAKVVAWYKSKALYVGAAAGLILGLVVNHFLKL